MKKLNRKLQLNKETIARLNNDQQQSIYGGAQANTMEIGCVMVMTNPTCVGNTCGCQAPVSLNNACITMSTCSCVSCMYPCNPQPTMLCFIAI